MAGAGEGKLGRMVLYAPEEPLDGALAMALDEVLLARAAEPVLRMWRWRETTITIGCFVRLGEAGALCRPSEWVPPVVRRWTGGGCVRHECGRDLSYSLVIPRAAWAARMRPFESYRWIHTRLAGVLREGGIGVGLTSGTGAADGVSRDCFRSPVAFDLVDAVSGEKVSGAGQKRTRQGLLHQGNLRAASLPEGFPRRLAEAFATEVREEGLGDAIVAEARALREKKYASADWTEKY